jgi:hypothetical protein
MQSSSIFHPNSKRRDNSSRNYAGIGYLPKKITISDGKNGVSGEWKIEYAKFFYVLLR